MTRMTSMKRREEYVKTSVTLPREMVDTLQRLSARTGSTMTDVVRRAIETERLIGETKRHGGKILLQQRDNSLREVIFRRRKNG